MNFTKIITATIIAFSATASLASTKCDHKGSNGLFANTNPPAATSVKTATATTSQVGVR